MSEQKVERGKVVQVHYTLRDEEGNVLESSEGQAPLEYLHGAGQLIPGLEEGMEGMALGEEREVSVPPEGAYGPRADVPLQRVPRELLPDDLEPEVGMGLYVQTPEGEVLPVYIAKVEEEAVWLDVNHPLAGKTLNFTVRIVGIRDATPEELAHGHVHGEGGEHG